MDGRALRGVGGAFRQQLAGGQEDVALQHALPADALERHLARASG
jgi:hypothetical protein